MDNIGIAPEVAWDKLSNFKTAQEIREYFQSENIKAFRAAHDSCAIAQWLINTTGEQKVSVSSKICIGQTPTTRLLFDGKTLVDTYEWNNIFPHTEASLTFIQSFDHGEYPELEA